MAWPTLLTRKQLKAIRAARHNPPTLREWQAMTAEFEDNSILDEEKKDAPEARKQPEDH